MNDAYYEPEGDRVRALRETREISLQEARRIAQGERLRWCLDHASHIDDVKAVLAVVIREIYQSGGGPWS